MPDLERPPGPLPWKERVELLVQPPALEPRRVAAFAATAAVVVIAAWVLLRTPAGPSTESQLPRVGSSADVVVSSSTTAPETVLVHAAGAVREPGVYELRSGARVTDVIDAAGGPADDADLDQLNLAEKVQDGERVYVPHIGEVVATSTSSDGEQHGPLDLNTATLDELDALPGIGPATAQAIIDERERRGGFTSVEDLLDVRGIGPAKLEQLRDLVTV